LLCLRAAVVQGCRIPASQERGANMAHLTTFVQQPVMPQSPADLPTPPDVRSSSSSNSNDESNATTSNTGSAAPGESTPAQADDLGQGDRVQWFGRPDAGEKPLGFWRVVVITLSGHIGVRPRAKRHEDFRRANGLHVFIAAVVYFFLVIAALIVLTNVIASR